MTDDQYQNWVYQEFWPKYPSEWGVKGSRAKLVKYVQKKKPSDEERREILLSLDAQIRESRLKKSAGEFIRWPHASTWYNEERYLDEIESSVSIKERAIDELAICAVQGCGEKVHGGRYRYCTDHEHQRVDPWKQTRKDKLEELGIISAGENITLTDLAERCREHLRAGVKSGTISMLPVNRLLDQ